MYTFSTAGLCFCCHSHLRTFPTEGHAEFFLWFMFSSRSHLILHFTFNAMIYFELIFYQDVQHIMFHGWYSILGFWEARLATFWPLSLWAHTEFMVGICGSLSPEQDSKGRSTSKANTAFLRSKAAAHGWPWTGKGSVDRDVSKAGSCLVQRS